MYVLETNSNIIDIEHMEFVCFTKKNRNEQTQNYISSNNKNNNNSYSINN